MLVWIPGPSCVDFSIAIHSLGNVLASQWNPGVHIKGSRVHNPSQVSRDKNQRSSWSCGISPWQSLFGKIWFCSFPNTQEVQVLEWSQWPQMSHPETGGGVVSMVPERVLKHSQQWLGSRSWSLKVERLLPLCKNVPWASRNLTDCHSPQGGISKGQMQHRPMKSEWKC